MTEKELDKRLHTLSLRACKFIIENIGLRKMSKEILLAKYIDELSIVEMCEKFGYEERYLGKVIQKSKKELNNIISREYKFMDSNLKEYIDLIINKDE